MEFLENGIFGYDNFVSNKHIVDLKGLFFYKTKTFLVQDIFFRTRTKYTGSTSSA